MIGQIIDRDDLPSGIESFIEEEHRWMEATLPTPSGQERLRSLLGREESMPKRYLRARWTDALRNIDRDSSGGKALARYFQKRYGSDQVEVWVRKPPANMRKDLLLLDDGVRAAAAREELSSYAEMLYKAEDRLRDEATVAERRPQDALFLLPHPGWMDPRSQFGDFDLYAHEDDKTIGLHQKGN